MSSYTQSARGAQYLFITMLLCFVPVTMAQAMDARLNISAEFKRAASVEIIQNAGEVRIKSSGVSTHDAFIQRLNRPYQTPTQATNTSKMLTHHYDLVVYF